MMPVTFSPIITDLGQGVFVPLATGIEFTFTHVAVGTGTSAVNSTATALENEIARFPIAGGGINTGGKSASINALITNHTNVNPQNYNISEIGFFGLDASNNTILFAIYRQGTTIINKVAGVDIAIPFALGLGALPTSNITVQLDTNISAMMALLGQHTSLNHPHTQYKRTHDASERLKIADGVDNDEAVSKSQLPIQATDSIVGISREATAAEVLAGALSGVFISPNNLSSAFPANDTAFQLSISLPNGYILKMGWTEYGELPAGVVTVPTTFANAFPSDCLFALANPYNPNLGGQMAFICTMRSWSDVGISVDMVELSGSGDQFNASYIWFAIGK